MAKEIIELPYGMDGDSTLSFFVDSIVEEGVHIEEKDVIAELSDTAFNIADFTSPKSGLVSRVFVKKGDEVKSGMKIIELDIS